VCLLLYAARCLEMRHYCSWPTKRLPHHRCVYICSCASVSVCLCASVFLFNCACECARCCTRRGVWRRSTIAAGRPSGCLTTGVFIFVLVCLCFSVSVFFFIVLVSVPFDVRCKVFGDAALLQLTEKAAASPQVRLYLFLCVCFGVFVCVCVSI